VQPGKVLRQTWQHLLSLLHAWQSSPPPCTIQLQTQFCGLSDITLCGHWSHLCGQRVHDGFAVRQAHAHVLICTQSSPPWFIHVQELQLSAGRLLQSCVWFARTSPWLLIAALVASNADSSSAFAHACSSATAPASSAAMQKTAVKLCAIAASNCSARAESEQASAGDNEI